MFVAVGAIFRYHDDVYVNYWQSIVNYILLIALNQSTGLLLFVLSFINFVSHLFAGGRARGGRLWNRTYVLL